MRGLRVFCGGRIQADEESQYGRPDGGRAYLLVVGLGDGTIEPHQGVALSAVIVSQLHQVLFFRVVVGVEKMDPISLTDLPLV